MAPLSPVFKVTTGKDQPLVISLAQVQANATDPDGDPVSFLSADSTSQKGGSIVDLGGATITYNPPAGFTGVDQFSYLITDNQSAQTTGQIEVTVQ